MLVNAKALPPFESVCDLYGLTPKSATSMGSRPRKRTTWGLQSLHSQWAQRKSTAAVRVGLRLVWAHAQVCDLYGLTPKKTNYVGPSQLTFTMGTTEAAGPVGQRHGHRRKLAWCSQAILILLRWVGVSSVTRMAVEMGLEQERQVHANNNPAARLTRISTLSTRQKAA
jgi:hypothetical protein